MIIATILRRNVSFFFTFSTPYFESENSKNKTKNEKEKHVKRKDDESALMRKENKKEKHKQEKKTTRMS